jgi:DNA mismatch repair ATPase MutS
LDCILALAEIAQQPNYSRPQVTESGNELIILGGKHPLIEQCVSNDTYIGASCKPTAKPIILLTGPNSSGKSVYLKQVALIVFLAHIGSFVPAAQATVPMADSIMIGLQSKDTATKVRCKKLQTTILCISARRIKVAFPVK